MKRMQVLAAGLTCFVAAMILVRRRRRRRMVNGFHDRPAETDLVELRSLSRALGCTIMAKCEHQHPGGSVKDRAAHALVQAAIESGELQPGGTIVQATGGNTGISLAMIAKAKGYRCHLTIPENISNDKKELLRILGATVTECPCVPFADPRSYCSRAHAIAKATKGAVLPDQFENVANAKAHYSTTGPELWRQCGQALDGFVCAAGTGGTIAGVSRFLKSVHGACATFLIDPTGSGLKCFVETGQFASSGSCFIDGIGISRRTANFGTAVVDGAFRGDDREAIEMAYYLLRNEGLFVGPSAALNVVGAVKLARKLGPGSRVATVLCDGGERYRATTFNAEWLASKGLTPKCEGDDLSFVKEDPRHTLELSPEMWSRVISDLVRNLPREWRGTTFNNSNLLGREGFACRLHDLLTRRAISGEPLISEDLVHLGQAEDYLRVASNVTTTLEAIHARQSGLSVSHAYSFPSALRMPIAAVVLTTDRAAAVRVYIGDGPPPFSPEQEQMLAHVGCALIISRGEPPATRRRERLDKEDDDKSVVLCVASALPDRGISNLRRAPPSDVDGIVGDGMLLILDEARIRPSDILVVRKRLCTPMTTPVAIQRLEQLASGRVRVAADADAPPPQSELESPQSELESPQSPPPQSELDAFNAHLQEMSGTSVDAVTRPVCYTAGLSALGALWIALIAGGGADVVMSSTAYGGSSQVTDILAARSPTKLRKHTFEVSGSSQIVDTVRGALNGLLQRASHHDGGSSGSATVLPRSSQDPPEILPRSTTVLFVEAPTNPDMKVPDLPTLATMLAEHAAATGARPLLLVDTTLAPMSRVMAKASSAAPDLPVMVLLSMSKSVSRGLTTAGALVANHALYAAELLSRAREVGVMLETLATDDQIRRLVDNHVGTEERCAKAYRVAMAVGEHLRAVVSEQCGVTMGLSTVSAEAANNGYASTTISFNLPPPKGTSVQQAAALAQRFVDELCLDKARFKPCVSFGQDNGLVYCTVPATSTQGAIKAEDKAKQEVGGVQLVRLSFPPSLDEEAACQTVTRAIRACYPTAA